MIFDFVPEKYRSKSQTPLLNGVLKAIEVGDRQILDLLEESRKQLFLTTATGSYLVNLAGSLGFSVPQNSGFDTAGFRKLAIPAIFLPKQSLSTFNRIAEVFYAYSILHPSMISESYEPFVLEDDDNLRVETDVGIVEVVFQSDKFSDITAVTAAELAGAINSQQNQIFADVFLDRSIQVNRLRLTTRSFGANAKIRVVGGTAQNIVRFPQLKETANIAGTVWNITKIGGQVYTDLTKFQWNGSGTNPKTYLLDIEDAVSIRGLEDAGGTAFSRLNGSYEISDAGLDYFVLRNIGFQFTGVALTQPTETSFCFTSKEYQTLYTNQEYAFISETRVGEIDITIPAVPPIVRRDLRGSSHLRGETLDVLDISQTSITVQDINGLPATGKFTLRGTAFMRSYEEENRIFHYAGKSIPSGGTQDLLLEGSGHQFPFLSAATAASALTGLSNPIFADLGGTEFEIRTPGVRHYFENNHESIIQDATLDIPLLSSNKLKVVTGILCPTGQSQVIFEHNLNSRLLYIQFIDSDTNEFIDLPYMPDTSQPFNRTKVFYGPTLEGGTIKAVIFVMNDGFYLGEVTQATPFQTLTSGGGTTTFTHGIGSSDVAFKIVNSDYLTIHATQTVIDSNSVSITYGPVGAGFDVRLFIIDFLNSYPDITRTVVSGVSLPPSPSTVTEVEVIHNLLSRNLLVEALNPPDVVFPLRIFIVNETKVKIAYSGNTSTITLDCLFASGGGVSVVESVDGGLALEDLNKAHIIRRVPNYTSYTFQILGTGYGTRGSGLITSVGTTVSGTGTLFTSEAAIGERIKTPSGEIRMITAITDDITLTVDQAFSTNIVSPLIYKILAVGINDVPVGQPFKYEGSVVTSFDVEFIDNVFGAYDVRFVFPDVSSRILAGFVENTKVKIENSGTFNQPVAGYELLKLNLSVQSQSDKYVYFKTGVTGTGLIIGGARCRRGGYFGGTGFKHYFNKNSDWNKGNYLKGLTMSTAESLVDANPNYVGSFLYDPEGTNYTVASPASSLVSAIQSYSSPGILAVGDVSGFDPSGHLFVDFGNGLVEGPIRYSFLQAGSPSQIIIDPAYVFQRQHLIGANIRMARSIVPVALTVDGNQYPTYITGVTVARAALEKILKDLSAVGVKVSISTSVPNLRYAEPIIPPFD